VLRRYKFKRHPQTFFADMPSGSRHHVQPPPAGLPDQNTLRYTKPVTLYHTEPFAISATRRMDLWGIPSPFRRGSPPPKGH
jgi:hypothetical protein